MHRLDTIKRASRLYDHARSILTDGSAPMASEWHMSEAQIRLVRSALGSVVGETPSVDPRPPLPAPTSSPRSHAQPFDQGTQLF